jgi:DNA repair protein RadC
MMHGLDREHCVTLNLDTKHRLIATTTVSIGSVDHTFMSPREVSRCQFR